MPRRGDSVIKGGPNRQQYQKFSKIEVKVAAGIGLMARTLLAIASLVSSLHDSSARLLAVYKIRSDLRLDISYH